MDDPATPDRQFDNPSARSIEGWVENTAPTSRFGRPGLADLWAHRELVFFFALRDIKVRYKQAFLGAAWAGLQPLVGALTFTLVFHGIADVDVERGSYFAFALVGFITWTFVSASVNAGMNSLLYNAELLTKVSFPRLVVPTAAVLPPLADLGVAMVIAIVVTLLTAGSLSAIGMAVGLPLGLTLLLLTVIGPALYFSATIVKYRDAGALVGLGLQAALFLSPVAYPPEAVPERWQSVYYLNPLAGALALLRAALADAELPSGSDVAISFAVAVLAAVMGLLHFCSTERELADII